MPSRLMMKRMSGKIFYQVKQGVMFAATLAALIAIGIQHRLWKVR